MTLRVIVATMVKNEEDIVEEWVKYHGSIFGYENIFVIDNISTDNTYNKLKKLKKTKKINVERKDNYKFKGKYMTEIMRNNNCDIFIPLDIDEFLVFYNPDIKVNKNVKYENIVSYLKNLYEHRKNQTFFKCRYIAPKKTNDNEISLKKFTHARVNYNQVSHMRKTFIFKKNVDKNFQIDHGNHMPRVKYNECKLYLIHFHSRTHKQTLQKSRDNITGLGYDINNLDISKNRPGIHHINRYYNYLKNPKNFDPKIQKVYPTDISIENFVNYLYSKEINMK